MTLRIRRESLPDADVRLADRDVQLTGPRLHSSLLRAGLDERLLEAVDELPGDRQGERIRILRDAGVDALDGLFAGVAASAARCDDDDAREEFVDVARQLGNGAPLGIRSSREDLSGGPIAIFAAASTTPTVEITLTAAFADRRLDHRRDVVDLLVDLAMGCDVEIVATGTARRILDEDHRDQLPGHLTEACSPQPTQTAQATATEALGSLDRDGTAVALLRALSSSPSGSLTYDDLRRELRLDDADDSLLPQTARRLEQSHSLVERLDRPDGQRVVSLLPAGETAVKQLCADVAIRRTSSTSWSDPEPVDSPPKNLPPCRVPPGKDEGTPPEDSPADRPDGEAADAAADASGVEYREGWVSVEYMEWPRHIAATSTSTSGEIVTADVEFTRDDDGRRPWWSFDDERDELVVGAEAHNPMQLWTALARSLASEKTLQNVLTPERIGHDLSGLATADRQLLRDARCIGWLPDDATGEDLVEDLREAREELLELSAGDDRSRTLRVAHGLAGTIIHLLDLLDVDVVREIRVPDFSQHFSRDERREDLTETIATGAAIQSRFGHFSAFRQLFEDRENKRSDALNPRVDPERVGSLIGSIVVAGDGVTDLVDDLADDLGSPRELHPDAPEIGVRIPVREAARAATARTVQRVLARKRMRPTRESVDLLHGFASDPYATAEALSRRLEPEGQRREIYLDEVRTALSTLDADRLLPDAAASARAGVAELLDADRPISQAELARRAEISTQSWRNHRDALVESGVVQEDGDGWRVCLPFNSDDRDERHRDLAEILPWWLLESPSGTFHAARELRSANDVLYEWSLEWDVSSEAIEAFVGGGPPDVGAIVDDLGVGPIWKLVCAACQLTDDPPPVEAEMGTTTRQTTLPAA